MREMTISKSFSFKLSTVLSKTSLIFSAISAVKSVLESPYNALRPSVGKLSVDNSRPTDAQQSTG